MIDMYYMWLYCNDEFKFLLGVWLIIYCFWDVGYFIVNVIMIGDWVVGMGKFDFNFVNEGEFYELSDWLEFVEN